VQLSTKTSTHRDAKGEHVTETKTDIVISHAKDAEGSSPEEAGKDADAAGKEHTATARDGVTVLSEEAGDAKKSGEEEGNAAADEAGVAHAADIKKAIDSVSA